MLNHKKLPLLITAGLAASLLTIPAFAQDAPPPKDPPAGDAPAQEQRRPRQNMFDRLETQLKLTEEQKTNVHPIFTDAQKQLTDIRSNEDLSAEDKKAQSLAVYEGLPEKTNPFLDDEQKETLAKFVERMKNPPQRGEGGPRGQRGQRGQRGEGRQRGQRGEGRQRGQRGRGERGQWQRPPKDAQPDQNAPAQDD